MMREFDEKHRPKNAQEYQQVFGTAESPRNREQDFEAERKRQLASARNLVHSSETTTTKGTGQ